MLGPLVNGLVRKNNITLIVNKSGYILIMYAPNPNTVNIKISTKVLNNTWNFPINNELKQVPACEVYYRPPTWTTYNTPTLLIDTVHLQTEEAVKAQVNSTIIIKCRKTINIIYCEPCPTGEIGHGQCYKITMKKQGGTTRIIKIQKQTTITINYKITKIQQTTPPTCSRWKPPKSVFPPRPPTEIVYVVLKSRGQAVLANSTMVCYPIERCIAICADESCTRIVSLKDCVMTDKMVCT